MRHWLEQALNGIAALILFIMMLLTGVDVIGRYFFNHPVPGAFELTEVLLVLLIFAGLPLVSGREEHVTITLLSEHYQGRLLRVQRVFVRLCTVLVLAVLAWRLWVKGAQLAQYGDMTVYLHIPLAPVLYAAAVLCGVSAGVVILNIKR